MRRSFVVLAVTVLLGSMAACGDSRTTVAPAATVTPTIDVTPTAAAVEPADSSGEPLPTVEPVDLVVMAASGGGGVDWRYAPLLAEALGSEVRNHGHLWARPKDVLSGAESGADVVAGAEVILLYFPPAGYEPPSELTCLGAVAAVLSSEDPEYEGPAWSPGQTWAPPEVTTAEDWQAWRAELDQDYDAIWTLREGQPTIVRGYGGWIPWLPAWRQVGVEAACMGNGDVLDQVMREGAEANGAVYVSMLDVFNGPQHDQDPGERGWIADDGMHLSEPGKDLLVEALAAAGFDFNEPLD